MSPEIGMEHFQKNTSEMLKVMRGMDEFCDVTLVSEDDERVRAHKVVLASASTKFRDLFQSGEEEEDYQVIHIKGVQSDFMTAMIDLIYKGETKVEEKECEKFLNLLRQYKLLKYNKNDKRRNQKCRYFNRGFCKFGVDCAFYHPKDDCEHFMAGNHCTNSTCSKRHRQVCKFWESKKGCIRKTDCQYLHENAKTAKSATRHVFREKCDACRFYCHNKDSVIVHKIKKHTFQLCLHCDHTIKNQRHSAEEKNLLQKLPDITSKDLDCLVKY